ncbi:MAG: hypothetical protein RBQ88_05205 [Desulfobulbus oligotrophicus]|nr:hypothetical protein [Desulfobulbus oligotrophicus]
MRTWIMPLLMALLLGAYTGLYSTPVLADDFNDGIDFEESSSQYGELDGSNRNYSYLKQRAKSLARSGHGGVVLSDSGALNSVILDAGAKITGDIIIIDESKGDKTVIAK